MTPLAVHATYSLDNHDGLAKAQRFRESGLWRVDAPAYFEGKYLALNSSVSPTLQVAPPARARVAGHTHSSCQRGAEVAPSAQWGT